MKQLMETGKEKGFVLYEEVNDLLADGFSSTREFEDLLTDFDSAGVEILDDMQIRAVNRWSKMDLPELTTLFFEFHGSERYVGEQIETVRALGFDVRRGAGVVERHHLEQRRLELLPGPGILVVQHLGRHGPPAGDRADGQAVVEAES